MSQSQHAPEPGPDPEPLFPGRIPRWCRQVGERLALSHHSQGMLLMAMLVSLVLGLWFTLAGVVMFAAMHLQYGGGSPFQTPLRRDAPPGWADLGWVALGVTGIGLICYGVYDGFMDELLGRCLEKRSAKECLEWLGR